MENKMSLAEFSKTLGQNEIPDVPKGPSLTELASTPVNEEYTPAQPVQPTEVNVDTQPVPNKRHIEVIDISEARALTLNMQRTAQEQGSERGIIPNLDQDEINKINSALDTGLEDYMAYTEKDRNEAVEVLRRHGYTDEEIDEIPYIKLLDIARAVKADEAEGTVGDMRHTVQEDGTIAENAMDKLVDNKIDDTVVVETAVKSEVIETPTQPQPQPQVAPKVIDKDEEFTREPSLAEVIGDKNIYVKYSEKPLNSYKRAKENKVKKLLSRQKRGNSVEVYLPNSNLKLNVFEIHQPAIITEIVRLTQMSQDIMIKKRVVEAILERSTPLCADGEDITTDALMNYISYDDLSYIYLAGAAANAIQEVPYGVECATCGTKGTIKLDIKKQFIKAMQEIDDTLKLSYKESDDFETCIAKSLANKIIEVKDKDARVVITLNNPSLLSNIALGEAIKSYVCETFAQLIPEALKYQSIDTKFDFVYNLQNPDVVKTISACILLSYINKIDTYTFEGNDKNWDSEEFLEESYDANVDGVDVMVEAMLSLEETTSKVSEKTIEDEFVKERINITTGNWTCASQTCKALNNTRVEGLELLILSLYNKMETNM
jgi:hypothetical protein